ncbi:MAG: insulinase family protein, partial [Bacteroidota bacterium]
ACLLVLMACKGSQTALDNSAEVSTPKSEVVDATIATTLPPSEPSLDQAVPFDPKTRTGKLENGLTYYIRANSRPENFAELRLAINAGSILETEDQLGLAHFVEHMCFNGTKSFPKNELVDYLESIGTQFGAHLNAYTSFDETVYQLRVPTDKEEQFAKGFQILEEWAHLVSFEGEEIDKERGVIIEEWRTRLGASWRMLMQTYPKELYQSRYVDRLPIGKLEVLKTFEHESLRKFYRDWYRPDLMAVVAVGDFDPDEVEEMIKTTFGRIPKASADAPERVAYPVPDHEETLIAIVSDEEAARNRVEIMYKHPVQKTESVQDYRKSLIQGLASNMLDTRLAELGQQAEPPFTFAYSGYSNLVRSKDAYSSIAAVGETQFISGLQALLIENERANRFGFTQTELDRIKNATLVRLEASVKESDKTESNRIVDRYVYHFLEASPAMSVEQRFALYQSLLPGITLQEVNEAFRAFFRPDNQVVVIQGVQKEGVKLPTEEEVRMILNRMKALDMQPYEDKVATGPLMEVAPEPGSVKNETFREDLGVTELELENGVKVILKPTDFKNDQISFLAYSPGGTSVYPDEAYMSASFADAIIGESGLGEFDNIQLSKYLSDKVVQVSPYVAELEEGIQGGCSPSDLETSLQMVYLYFTQARKDEDAFASMMSKNKAFFPNLLSNPEYWFRNEMQELRYDQHPRRKFIYSLEDLEAVELEEALEVYRDRFADASDFTFVFVGAFEPAEIKPLLAQYLGSLPALNRGESWKNVNAPAKKEAIERTYYRGKEPKSSVELVIHDEFEWNTQERFHLSAAMQVLQIMMTKSMRESMGGVYGVQTRSSTNRHPEGSYSVNISFTCSPDNVEELIGAVRKDMQTLIDEGPSEENMNKVKETIKNQIQVNLKSNSYWLRGLEFAYQNELDPSRIIQAEDRVNALSIADIQAVANAYFDLDKMSRFVLMPEKEEE